MKLNFSLFDTVHKTQRIWSTDRVSRAGHSRGTQTQQKMSMMDQDVVCESKEQPSPEKVRERLFARLPYRTVSYDHYFYKVRTGASTPYKRWSKCTMKKIGGGKFFCRNLAYLGGDVRKLFMHFAGHQVSDFKAKIHQIRFRLGLRPRPRWGS